MCGFPFKQTRTLTAAGVRASSATIFTPLSIVPCRAGSGLCHPLRRGALRWREAHRRATSQVTESSSQRKCAALWSFFCDLFTYGPGASFRAHRFEVHGCWTDRCPAGLRPLMRYENGRVGFRITRSKLRPSSLSRDVSKLKTTVPLGAGVQRNNLNLTFFHLLNLHLEPLHLYLASLFLICMLRG